MADMVIRNRRWRNPLKAGALQNAVLNSTCILCIATDDQGVIQIFSAGAERMLGYTEAELAGKRTAADLADAPGFEALAFKASHGIEDRHELTWIRKDGSRLAAVVSVTVLRDAKSEITGYLLIATDNSAQEGFRRVERPEPASQPQPTRGAPRRSLLYVEDQSASFGVVERLVARRPDVLLLHASSVALGIELARSARPDVILLNIDLPGTSALQFMKLLRADPATENTPLLALGADAAAKSVTQALDAGFFRYLTKPLEPEGFVAALDYALEFAALERAERHDRAFTSAHSH
jgi:PAS domain S-box-containing protein